MRNVSKKHEIRKARDFIKVRLAPRRKNLYKYKIIPNEVKSKKVIILFKKISVRIFEKILNFF